MIKKELLINDIPAILWGPNSQKLFIAIHGNMSSKSDDVISILAEEVVPFGYQVLSFDLPQHGDRKNEATLCKVQNCVEDLNKIMNFAQARAKHISLFACSMGAYFSLLSYKAMPLEQSLFLSPVVNMERIISNMILWFNVSEERLEKEKEIATPIGEVLYWDYYNYVKEHPVVRWESPTSILYGRHDELCEFEYVNAFAKHFGCDLEIDDDGEHYFHTDEQLKVYRAWLKKHLAVADHK